MAAMQRLFGDPEVLLGAVRSPEQIALQPLLDAAVAAVVGVHRLGRRRRRRARRSAATRCGSPRPSAGDAPRPPPTTSSSSGCSASGSATSRRHAARASCKASSTAPASTASARCSRSPGRADAERDRGARPLARPRQRATERRAPRSVGAHVRYEHRQRRRTRRRRSGSRCCPATWMATARNGADAHPSWNCVSNRANARPWFAPGASRCTMLSKQSRPSAAARFDTPASTIRPDRPPSTADSQPGDGRHDRARADSIDSSCSRAADRRRDRVAGHRCRAPPCRRPRRTSTVALVLRPQPEREVEEREPDVGAQDRHGDRAELQARCGELRRLLADRRRARRTTSGANLVAANERRTEQDRAVPRASPVRRTASAGCRPATTATAPVMPGDQAELGVRLDEFARGCARWTARAPTSTRRTSSAAPGRRTPAGTARASSM